MENIYYLLLFSLICWYFVSLRKIAERAKKHAEQYCQDHQLQFINIARRNTRLTFNKRYGIHLHSTFDFEFSGDGQSSYQGQITLRSIKLEQVNLPPYRID